MKFVDDPEMAAWLPTKPSFQWDAGNSTKNALKHGNSIDEIESVFDGVVALVGKIVEPWRGEDRWLVLGVAFTGKLVSIVFTRRENQIRPISCRGMRPKEKVIYGEQTKESRVRKESKFRGGRDARRV